MLTKQQQLDTVRARAKTGYYGELLRPDGILSIDPYRLSESVARDLGLQHWEMVCLGEVLNEYKTSVTYWRDYPPIVLDPGLYIENHKTYYSVHGPDVGASEVAYRFLKSVVFMSAAVVIAAGAILLASNIISTALGI